MAEKGFQGSATLSKKASPKMDAIITAKQEAEAKATTLETKLKQFEAENAELKAKVFQNVYTFKLSRMNAKFYFAEDWKLKCSIWFLKETSVAIILLGSRHQW